MEIAYSQYEKREQILAKDGVLQLVRSIEYGRKESVLDEKTYKSEILKKVKHGTLGKDSQRGFFIYNEDNICLISYDYPEMEGHSLDDLPIEIKSGKLLSDYFQSLRSGNTPDGSFICYTTGNQEKEKTSYAIYYPQWGWIIGAGYYKEDGELLQIKQKQLWENFGKKILNQVMIRIVLFSLLICSIILFISIRLRKSYKDQSKIYKDYELFRETLEDNLYVMITDSEGNISQVNSKYCELTQSRKEDILGQYFSIHFHPEKQDSLVTDIKDYLSKHLIWSGIIKGVSYSNEEFWIQAQIKSIYSETGSLKGYMAVGLDITELYTVKDRLKRSAFIDYLTGFGNWEKLLHDYDELGSPLISYYNIDGFNSIYQFYGKEIGDHLLKHIANDFDTTLTKNEHLYRIHYDTFVILSQKDDKDLFIERSCTRLNTINEQIIELEDFKYHVSMRAGIAVSSTTENLVLADIALENAKESSDGIAILDDKDISGSQVKRNEIQKLHMIKEAIANSCLFLSYQPIFNISSGVVDKYECLIRLESDDGETMSPSDFIELTKKGRIYKKITRFVIDTACRQFQNRKENFSINLTLEDLSNQNTIDFLIEKAREYQVNTQLILEIVETEELRDFEGIRKIIKSLKTEGLRIAIDDFGSGFSNFKYLLELNADFIKIDGSLIRNLLTDQRNQTLVISIVNFAKCANMKTIAEYVENQDLLDILKKNSIDYGQGYYIGKPVRELPAP